MNVWIITTGNSDVQLKNKDRWDTLSSKVRSQLGTSKQFSFSESEQSGKKLWRYPSRAMGVVYGQALAEHYNDLDFPLLNSFFNYLDKEQIELNKIIVLLTDQSDVVSDLNKKKPSHPYWQDTCTLKPILQHYLENAFPDVAMDSDRDFIVLKPQSNSVGLDDWNEVLNLVQQEFIKLDIPEDATVYVSHQAGTPAISSAVQFSSLARFRNNVEFLVSNEYSQETRPISRSSYLGAIQLQEAKALLKRHDYSGVRLLVNDYLDSETKILLDAAIQWNLAKFDEFKNELQKLTNKELADEVNERAQHWWWTAYEAAYLGVIRLEQKNAIEAFFHSFRSVEGLISKWAESCFSEYVEPNNDSPLLKIEILNKFPDYLGKKDQAKRKAEFQEKGTLILSGFPLYALLRADRKNWKQECKELTTFIEKISPQRNKLFHRLKGLQEDEVFDAWQVDKSSKNRREDWEALILGYLNFVARQKFSSLKESSRISKVHEELANVIANYEYTP